MDVIIPTGTSGLTNWWDLAEEQEWGKTRGLRWRQLEWKQEEKRESGKQHRRDAKVVTHHLPPTDWCPASPWATAAVDRLSPSFYFGGEGDVVWHATSLWSLQVSCALPTCCCLPQWVTAGVEWETEVALMLREHCSVIAEILLLPAPF